LWKTGEGVTYCRSLVSSSVEDKGDDETVETENLSELRRKDSRGQSVGPKE
jgi:hypothetical protein